MTESHIVYALLTTISFLVGILGYFLNRWVQELDSSIDTIKTEVKISTEKINDKLQLVQNDLTKVSISSTSAYSLLKQNSTNMAKEIEKLEKLHENINELTKKVIVTETKVENLGKVILVDSKKAK